METRANYALIGLFTLAVIAAAFGFVYWFSGSESGQQNQTGDAPFVEWRIEVRCNACCVDPDEQFASGEPQRPAGMRSRIWRLRVSSARSGAVLLVAM